MFKKKLVSIATCGNNREASCLNQESDGQVQGKTSVITTHLWWYWLRKNTAFVNILMGWWNWDLV